MHKIVRKKSPTNLRQLLHAWTHSNINSRNNFFVLPKTRIDLYKMSTSHGNEVLTQNTRYLIQRPCYQQGSPCQDPAGNWTTWRSPDDRKETQTAMVWSCFPCIRSGQNHVARHSERGKKTRQTEEDNIRKWTGLEFGKSQKAVENRRKWRKLVAKSSVVSQRPSRLRDWWWQ